MMIGDDSLAGSSPRMRGAPVAVVMSSVELGIIPADAGSTERSVD